MVDLTEINKLDQILKFIIEHQKDLTFGELRTKFNFPNKKEIDEILIKLEKDGFIKTISHYDDQLGQKNLPIYLSTFDGRLFSKGGGYEAKALE